MMFYLYFKLANLSKRNKVDLSTLVQVIMKVEALFLCAFHELWGLGIQTFLAYSAYWISKYSDKESSSSYLGTVILITSS